MRRLKSNWSELNILWAASFSVYPPADITVVDRDMTRKGPPKQTRRDEMDKIRSTAARITLRDEAKETKSIEVMKIYDTSSRPDMPTFAWDQRVLRDGLRVRGEVLLRVGDTGVKRKDLLQASKPLGIKARGQIRNIDLCDGCCDDDS